MSVACAARRTQSCDSLSEFDYGLEDILGQQDDQEEESKDDPQEQLVSEVRAQGIFSK
jgi:hypothetical protein